MPEDRARLPGIELGDREHMAGPHRGPSWAVHLHYHLHRLERMILTTQDDIDTIANDLATVDDNLATVHDELAAGINELEAQIANGKTPNLDALRAVKDKLGVERDALTVLATSVPQMTPPPAATEAPLSADALSARPDETAPAPADEPTFTGARPLYTPPADQPPAAG